MKKEINIINLLYEFKKNKNIKNLYLEIEELKANNEIEQENIKGLKDKISQIKTNLFEIEEKKEISELKNQILKNEKDIKQIQKNDLKKENKNRFNDIEKNNIEIEELNNKITDLTKENNK